MRLALLVEYYPPSRASAAIQMADLAHAFVREGHEVTVFTADPDMSSATARVEAGVTVVRVPTGKAKGIGLVRRALNEIVMPFAMWRGARRCDVPVEEFDGVIWYSPTIFLAPFVAWIKYKSRVRSYLILRDLFPQWALDAGVMRRGMPYYFFKVFEHFQYWVADVIGVQSPANLEYFANQRTSSSRIEVLFNWIDLSRSEPVHTQLLHRYGISGNRIAVYGGNMGVAQDVDNLLRLAEGIRQIDDVRMLLVGAGSEVERLRFALSERRLNNVILADEVDPEDFRKLLRECDVGLISLDRRLTTHNIPGKLLAYLEAGLPVVASVNPGNDLLTILAESGAGIGLINGQDREFAQAVLTLVNDSARRASMSERARALATRRFSVESVALQLTTALERSPTASATSTN